MRIYHTAASAYSRPSTRIYEAPGMHQESDPAEWWERDIRNGEPVAVQFAVNFAYGVAEVADPLGRFLIAKGLAQLEPVSIAKVEPTFRSFRNINQQHSVA